MFILEKMSMIKQKRGQSGDPREFGGGLILGIIFLLLVVTAIFFYFTSFNKAVATVTPEDLDLKYESCKVSYNSQGGSFRGSFCEKFDPIGGSLLFGSKNYVSCQYRPIIERLYGAVDKEGKPIMTNVNSLEEAVSYTRSYCSTITIPGAELGDELAFATAFCKNQKDSNARFNEVWANGFVFDKNCIVKTYPSWHEGGPEKFNCEGDPVKGLWISGTSCPKKQGEIVFDVTSVIKDDERANHPGQVCCTSSNFSASNSA